MLEKENSLLVDLGSRISVGGINTLQSLIDDAKQYGHSTKIERRGKRLNVNGVGKGSVHCDNVATIPIAVQFENEPASLDTFKVNVAEGHGADLPAIFGSESMQDKDAVLALRKGKELIAFPGPGGYKIEWSPGSKLLPMVPAPSGHLVIPCGKFKDAMTPNKDEQLAFMMDYSRGSSSSSTSH